MIKGQSWQHADGQRRRMSIGRRPSRRFLSRCLIALSILGFFQFLDLHLRYRDALHAKYLPTDFSDSADALGNTTAHLNSLAKGGGFKEGRAELLASRQHWTRLGGGREGEAFVYNNSVVKVYNERSSPFRNCAPVEGTGLRWPTEIPATLIMGGSKGFIPIEDFFRAPATAGGELRWHMVTPFLRAGTLKKLGVATAEKGMSYQQVDSVYRPSFEFLLSALENLHVERNLCHDDIKLDNIFVVSPEDPTRWVLGDLGNARQPDHPYHYSSLWTADTPQLSDCRLNDVVRLTKSYLAFVRAASANQAEFNRAFFDGTETLSQLYWSVINSPAPAAEIRSRSRSNRLAGLGSPGGVAGESQREAARAPIGIPLSISVSRHLRVGANESRGRFFGLVRFLGVPVSACSGAG